MTYVEEQPKQETVVFFVYGTLKKGQFNHTRYGFDQKTKYLGEGVLDGAKLYDLGGCPAIILTKNKRAKVYGELYECSDSELLQNIRFMEGSYLERKVQVNGLEVIAYVKEGTLKAWWDYDD